MNCFGKAHAGRMKSRQFRLPLRHGRPIEADDPVEAVMPATFPSPFIHSRLCSTATTKGRD
ncbi:hypothetical protein IE4771_CH01652 [Rhizobium etli bv. mimosae str. IE4771]|uniref:Uncharacterized protein n=1 Tax=Rhizobium etli bv. mimosae str. IE4771 TaxID=1432050 RepID=A0A060HYY5_RHIET|nr:hypothetical protein IE4771_CH01652 [Rhizobium sp. IE4771]